MFAAMHVLHKTISFLYKVVSNKFKNYSRIQCMPVLNILYTFLNLYFAFRKQRHLKLKFETFL